MEERWGEVTFELGARVLVKTKVEYGKQPQVTAVRILPHQETIKTVHEGPTFNPTYVCTVRCGLHGDDPDGFITAARERSMKVTITRLRNEMGVPEVEVVGPYSTLVTFMGDRYCQNAEVAVEWIADELVAQAAKFVNENTWEPLKDLPNNVIWEG